MKFPDWETPYQLNLTGEKQSVTKGQAIISCFIQHGLTKPCLAYIIPDHCLSVNTMSQKNKTKTKAMTKTSFHNMTGVTGGKMSQKYFQNLQTFSFKFSPETYRMWTSHPPPQKKIKKNDEWLFFIIIEKKKDDWLFFYYWK